MGKDNNKHGQGTYYSADGSKYVGQLENGKFHGQGTLSLANGNKYVGQFKERINTTVRELIIGLMEINT